MTNEDIEILCFGLEYIAIKVQAEISIHLPAPMAALIVTYSHYDSCILGTIASWDSRLEVVVTIGREVWTCKLEEADSHIDISIACKDNERTIDYEDYCVSVMDMYRVLMDDNDQLMVIVEKKYRVWHDERIVDVILHLAHVVDRLARAILNELDAKTKHTCPARASASESKK